MKVISGHLTALDRQAVRAMLSANETQAQTKRRRWTMDRTGNRLIVTTYAAERADAGRTFWRDSRAMVQL